MDLTGFLKKKLGPLPMGAWIFIAVVVAFALVKLHGGKKGSAAGTSSDPTQQGQFSTSTTRTDPKTGETITYQASGPNSSIQSPAQLTYAASPMGYSGGDVYVNLPATPAAPAPVPAPIPLPPPPCPHPEHHGDHDDHDDAGNDWDWLSDLFGQFTPQPQTTSVQVPHWEVPNYVGQHQGGYSDGPGNSGDSLFNPDNVQRIFG